MRIGVLTGGGDTAALNAALYGIALEAEKNGHHVIGFKEGWKGILGVARYDVLSTRCIDPREGGTILRTSRTKLKQDDGTLDQAIANIERRVDAFIAIGGDDTLSVAMAIKDRLNKPFIAITKTIDNDVGTNASPADNQLETMVNYFTPGFPTAAKRICEYVDQLKTTAYSHKRIILLEAMGRKPGWLALASASAEPDLIVVPESPIDFDEFQGKVFASYTRHNRYCSMIVVAEGAKYTDGKLVSVDESSVDAFGHSKLGGAAQLLADRLKTALSKELGTENFNSVNPGYLYRSGNPSALDMKYAMKLGEIAVEGICHGKGAHAAVVQMGDGDLYAELIPVSQIVKLREDNTIIPRLLNPKFYDPVRMNATKMGLSYLRMIRD